MEKHIGKVIEVFIPVNNSSDIMLSTKIGFKILLNDKIIEIIEEQDEYNSTIYKDDLVTITNNDNNIEIEKYEGADHE